MTEIKWNYINKNEGYPTSEGYYLGCKKVRGKDICIQMYYIPECRYDNGKGDFCQGFFDSSHMEEEYSGVYAWAERPTPAPRI